MIFYLHVSDNDLFRVSEETWGVPYTDAPLRVNVYHGSCFVLDVKYYRCFDGYSSINLLTYYSYKGTRSGKSSLRKCITSETNPFDFL